MGCNEERNLASLYTQPYDFTQSVHDDREAFFALDEFAALHDIDGVKVPCVVTGAKNIPNTAEGVFTRTRVLYTYREKLREPVPGMSFRLDGEIMTVLNAGLVQGEIRRIELGVADV